MRLSDPEVAPALLAQIEERVRRTTHDRIRGLSVAHEGGRVVLRGHSRTRHAKQLALHAALEMVAGNGVRECITVG